ncbi:DPP IV N-terminal domain-containing protein [Kineobactrum salinum]|uniref:Dipeptidylpeptidase IV N-terminal domain-containing protein n=1 Tax=Kineobactrum salinum TaxID=2708301 RepID=A0A6C0U4B8_9GAMM|nr:DPP IV N-terminal domain-containing protein [Kineobactrum salinum]QIB67000.1 hypothetical protein G3T16_17985 [Kineobactrum salinum]
MRETIAAGILGLTLAGSAQAVPTTEEMSARYARATASTASALASLVLNASVSPHWLDGGGFWYRRALRGGGEFRVVQASGINSVAFDHARLATSVSQAADAMLRPLGLNVTALQPGQWVEVTVEGNIVRCTLVDYRCAEPIVPQAAKPRQLLSPDGRKAVFVKDHDLWLKEIASGRESALTANGEAYFAWGKLPDASLLALVNESHALPLPPGARVGRRTAAIWWPAALTNGRSSPTRSFRARRGTAASGRSCEPLASACWANRRQF